MSYIIAFVRFPESDANYRVSCFRTDLKAGDCVIVRVSDGSLRRAIVSKLRYLNWNCRARIECKFDEAAIEANGTMTLPENSPLHVGLATREALVEDLERQGWISIRPTSKVNKFVLTYTNFTQTAKIFLRRNGVDLQIMEIASDASCGAEDDCQTSTPRSRVVRHFLAQTTFNLYEGISRFANSFLNNEGDYDRFFKAVGSRDRRTPELRANSGQDRDDLRDICGAISGGSGGLSYLGDGMWVGSGGQIRDWRR